MHMIPGVKKGNKVKQVGHSSQILALAISTDSKFLVSAGLNFFCLLFSERKESVFKMLIKSYLIFSSLSKFKNVFGALLIAFSIISFLVCLCITF